MIRLNVFIQAEESKKAAVLEAGKALVAGSLNDEGCIAYDLFESATRAGVFIICETWKDAETLSAHEKTAHFTKYVPEIQSLSSMKIEKFEY